MANERNSKQLGTIPGTSVDGAFPPWNFNVCTILTSSSPMSSANLKPWNFNDFKAFLLQSHWVQMVTILYLSEKIFTFYI
jgi:hypothetical protein